MSSGDYLSKHSELFSNLKIDCSRCSGLCCVALYCVKTDGFPENKEAGTPCKNLMPDFRCAIHSQLAQLNMRGCLAYDCFGAGQLVTQLFSRHNYQTAEPPQADTLLKTFLTVFQLHQMLWYLIEASSLSSEESRLADIDSLILEGAQITAQPPHLLLYFPIEPYRLKVNQILKAVSQSLSPHPGGKQQSKHFLGKDFKKANLDGRDFSMALMIASNLEGCSLQGANFLGADIRDADIKNTDLSKCVFLTQMQLNSARGNSGTKIPANLSVPTAW